MLIDTVRAEMVKAMKKKETVKKLILQMLISESSKKSKIPGDEAVIAAAKALIKSNNIILVRSADEVLTEQNLILNNYIPASNLSQEEFDNIFNSFMNESIANTGKVTDYRNGNEKLFGFIMGQLVNRFPKNVEKNDIKEMIQKEFNKENK